MAAEVAPEKLRQWYLERDVLGTPGEVVLGGHLSLDETVDLICRQIGPVVPHPDREDARFL